MVARYKKSGGFVQLLQVMETCGTKKYEQFIGIISTEDPNWAAAIKEKTLTFDKILNWSPETLMEVLAQVNTLAFGSALKGLSDEKLTAFLGKLSPQDRRKIESQLNEANPTPAEISSAVMKVISETRNLLTSSILKADKIDPALAIPENFEEKLSAGNYGKGSSVEVEPADTAVFSAGSNGANAAAVVEIDRLQKKLALLNKEVQALKQENVVMKDKLDKIKRIA